MCLPHIVSNWCCQLYSSTTTSSHYWQLFQASPLIQRWSICQTSLFPLLCSQHRDTPVGTSKQDASTIASTHTMPSLETWLGMRGSLLQPRAAICFQSAWNKAVLVQVAQIFCHVGNKHPHCPLFLHLCL